MGDSIKAMPDYHSAGRGTMKRKKLPEGIKKKLSSQCQQLNKSYTDFRRWKPVLPEGITHKLSHYCQQLAAHPDIIEQVNVVREPRL